MKIRRIETADFRRSELTMFNDFTALNRRFVDQLRADDVIVFASKTGNQLLFVHGFTQFTSANDGQPRTAIMSIRHRILNGVWNPLRLANYATEAGLKVEGLKVYEEHLKRMLG